MSVDIIKYEKELNRKTMITDLIELYKSNNMEILSLASIAMLDCANIMHVPGIITIPLFGYLLYNCEKDQMDLIKLHHKELIDKTKDTDTYKNIVKLYDIYLNDLVDLYNKLGKSSAMESVKLFDYMITEGYLSKNHINTYDKNIVKFSRNRLVYKREIDEIKGVAVLTGKSVCRHNAKLLYDLECKLGNKSYLATVKAGFDISNVHNMRKIKKMDHNHLMNILIDEDNKAWGYCPTANTFLDYEVVNGKDLLFRDVVFLRDPFYMYYKYEDKDSEKNMYNIDDLYNTDIKPRKFDIHDISSLLCFDRDTEALNELYKFYKEEEDLVNELSDLYEILMPREAIDNRKKQKQLIL